MTPYFDKVTRNRNSIIIDVVYIIDNSTLRKIYTVATNLHCDYGIQKYMMNTFHHSSKKKLNRLIADYRKATGFKLKLYATDNDLNYTRIIYRMNK